MSPERWKAHRNPPPLSPIRELDDIRRRLDEDIVRPVMRAVWERLPEEARSWSPPIDIFEKADTLIVKADIPGVKEQNIDVSASEDNLTIKGERAEENDVKGEDYYRNELTYGSFFRSIELPFSVDTKSIEAVYEEGVLRVTLQRAGGAKPKKVSIQVKKEKA